MNDQPILVAGARRSGKTFAGRVLSVSRTISYIHKPFNYEQGVKGLEVDCWFPYITTQNFTKPQARILIVANPGR